MRSALQLSFPQRSFVGAGAVEELGTEASRLGSHALLVTGRNALREAGITDRLMDVLQKAGVGVALFDEAPPEPDLETVDAARRRVREEKCNLVVEAGGGSAIDVGKAAAALAHEDAPTEEFHQGRDAPTAGLPHIAVATTSGTGSEATRNSVLIDHERRLKKSIRSEAILPRVAIVDPELTLPCPPAVTAASGMDALVQAIESYFSVYAIPTTEALSLKAVELIVPALPAAFRDGGDLGARAAMSEGSFLAGLALGSARLGAVHGLAHPLGVTYGLRHGVVCGALMPPVLERNAPAARQKYDTLAEIAGQDPVRMLSAMLTELGLPQTLGAYPNVDDERIVLECATTSGSSAANPVPVDEGYVLSILRSVCSGAR